MTARGPEVRTGKDCKNGHVDPPRYPNNHNCKPCRYERNARVRNEQDQRRRVKTRRRVLEHYSPELVCARCGYDDYDGLQLDHINEDGRAHRETIKPGKPTQAGGYWTYRVVVRDGFPEGFQVLCNTCNQTKRREARA